MKRIFILGSPKFPRGSAGANYDQYVAMSLVEKKWNVIILGKGRNRKEDYNNGKYIYKGIEYYNEPETYKVKYGFDLIFFRKMTQKYNITKDDYFIIRDLGWMPQLWIAKLLGTDHFIYVHFEDLRPEQFRCHLINPQYWCSQIKWCFKLKGIHKALPISEALERIDKSYGCKTLRLPIMADPDEFGEFKKECKPEVINFIYPGAKLNGCEDNIKLMLESFCTLTDNEKRKVRLNITGTTMQKLREKLGEDAFLVDELSDVLIIHRWLEYSELIELYRNMDFLILVRFVNPVTVANFPSKVPETLSFGIIPICTRVGEYTTNYLYNGENSIVFEPDSKDACTAAIKKAVYINNEEFLRYRSEARKTAVEKFGYKRWAERLNDFILS